MTGAGIRRFLSFLMEDDKYKGKGCDKNEPKEKIQTFPFMVSWTGSAGNRDPGYKIPEPENTG